MILLIKSCNGALNVSGIESDNQTQSAEMHAQTI